MKLVKLTLWQKFKHWLASLPKGERGIPSTAKGVQSPPLRAIKGGKLKAYDGKETVYNPREFRADKGPRK